MYLHLNSSVGFLPSNQLAFLSSDTHLARLVEVKSKIKQNGPFRDLILVSRHFISFMKRTSGNAIIEK